MTRISKVRWILLRSSRLPWQITGSAVVTAALLPLLSAPRFAPLIQELRSPSTFVTVLGVIGGILALASSIAYGHLLQFMTSSETAKSDAYHRLQERLYELDEFVEANGPDSELSESLLGFSYDLRRLQLKDYPTRDWLERLSPFEDFLTGEVDGELATFRAHLLIRLNYLEELMNIIGISSIRQILLRVIASPLLKCLGVLAALMLCSALGIVLSGYDSVGVALALLPIFFAVFSAFLFVEVGFTVYREIEEVTDFMDTDDGTESREGETDE